MQKSQSGCRAAARGRPRRRIRRQRGHSSRSCRHPYCDRPRAPFVPNKERGVYRSTDGGKTWKNVLFVSESCGAADLELQPGSPTVIFASMWHGQRKPWTIISGAREGGIYKSVNGGDTWTKLAGGLPNDLFGR